MNLRTNVALVVAAVLFVALAGPAVGTAELAVRPDEPGGTAADSPHLAGPPAGGSADTPHLAAADADTPHLPAAEPAEVEITDHPKTPEELLARMAKAREAIRTLDLRFRTTVRSAPNPDLAEGGDVPWPVFVSESRLCLAGDRHRFESTWQSNGGEARRIAACDGRLYRNMTLEADELPLLERSTGGGPWQRALRRLGRGEQLGSFGSLSLPCRPEQSFSGPLADFVFGPMVDGLPWHLARLSLGQPQYVDGYRCHVLLAEIGPWEYSYYVSPRHGWSILRIETRVIDPAVTAVVDPVKWVTFFVAGDGPCDPAETERQAQYQCDEQGCWHIAQCSKQVFCGYGPQRYLVAEFNTVVEAATVNRPIPDDTFVVQFPDGLTVCDGRRGVTFTWDSSRSPAELEQLLRAKESQQRAESERRQAEYAEWLAQEDITLLEPGGRAPLLELTALDGSPVLLADLRGRWVLLVFWNAASADSLAVLPRLKALHERFAPTGRFRVLGLSTDFDVETLEAVVEEHELPWTQVWLEGDAGRAVQKAYLVGKVPWFVLVTPDGCVEAFSPYVEAAVEAVEQALAEPEDQPAP